MVGLALLGAAGLAACHRDADAPAGPGGALRPNILFIVWDTVRADRLSLYGHARATTPEVEAFARDALVFEDVVSAGSTTVPSHGSLFTGLLPVQHGAHEGHRWLADGHETLAERLRAAGYQTYLWSANPHVSSAENFQQGFDREAHPWDPAWRAEALRIVRAKVRGDRSSELGERVARDDPGPWAIKAAGALAQRDLAAWLAARDPERPWFAFLNYMEAHRPYVPSRAHRERAMTPEEVERSYRLDRSWLSMWAYTFGLREYGPDELELTRRTYDAALMELDDLFAELLGALGAAGWLEDTVVILTSDHGELLGEHHMLDHQYAVYQPLVRVPLVIRDPQRFPAGREARPVQSFDLFPTVLEIAGLEPPPPEVSPARSLLRPEAGRVRLAEYPAPFTDPIDVVSKLHPDWDPAPFARALRALQEGPWKLVWGGDGRHELYDLAADPHERRDLAGAEPETLARLVARLDARLAELPVPPAARVAPPPPSEEQRRLLEGLGYLLPPEASGGEASGASAP